MRRQPTANLKTQELKSLQKERQIDTMTAEAVLNELKDKRLPTYGTGQERRDRLKKQYGIVPKSKSGINQISAAVGASGVELGMAASAMPARKVTTTDKIDQIKINRDARRLRMEEARKLKSEREANNELQGIKVDVDFQAMVEAERKKVAKSRQHIFADQMKISVCFKKRPIFQQELADGEIDVISVANPKIIVHDCKYKVDGVSKTIENTEFRFDNSFSHNQTNEELYFYQVRPILDLIFNQGIVTIFAYGQTGSGKTYTMNGLQSIAVKDLFERGIDYWENHQRNFTVTVSMYEIYGGKLYDLLNEHNQLSLREDKNNMIQIAGLKEQFVDNDDQILDLIKQGNTMRTTHATKANDTSSRSHAITQIKIQEQGVRQCGKLLLVDLAGSERAQDCQSNSKDRQAEGAEINQSLLGLKECVRALDGQKGQASQGQHVPFRQSKLTMVLRDSFLASEKVKIVMLTCICPGMSSANHTLNSLRYAERLKENQRGQGGQGAGKGQKALPQEQINEELRVFMEKHGKQLGQDEEQDDLEGEERFNNLFYQDENRLDDINEDDQDVLLNDDANDLLLQNELEDEVAVIQTNPKQQQFNQKKSPNTMTGSTRKGANLANISNTVHGPRAGQNQSNLSGARNQPAMNENVYPSQQNQVQNPSKRIASHQNQFSNNKQTASTSPIPSTQKMSPALQKAMGVTKPTIPKRSAPTYGNRQHEQEFQYQQKLQMDQVPQQQMNPPAPLMSSQQMPTHPSKSDQIMQDQQNDHMMFGDMNPTGDNMGEMDNQLMEEERMRAEENIYNTHLDAVKEEVQLIQREGEMITTLERAIKNEEDYDMREYLANARQIAMQKIEMYQQLMQNIDEFQDTFISKQ